MGTFHWTSNSWGTSPNPPVSPPPRGCSGNRSDFADWLPRLDTQKENIGNPLKQLSLHDFGWFPLTTPQIHPETPRHSKHCDILNEVTWRQAMQLCDLALWVCSWCLFQSQFRVQIHGQIPWQKWPHVTSIHPIHPRSFSTQGTHSINHAAWIAPSSRMAPRISSIISLCDTMYGGQLRTSPSDQNELGVILEKFSTNSSRNLGLQKPYLVMLFLYLVICLSPLRKKVRPPLVPWLFHRWF